jgi:pSer/pThr/pTyr-binding forkhead associated (FHA) protein
MAVAGTNPSQRFGLHEDGRVLPLLIRANDLRTGVVAESAFLKSPVRIGRSDANELRLEQAFVSQWHAIVYFDEHEIRYVDLGSTNGSLVDGVPAERNVPAVIGPATRVRIGALELTFARLARSLS